MVFIVELLFKMFSVFFRNTLNIWRDFKSRRERIREYVCNLFSSIEVGADGLVPLQDLISKILLFCEMYSGIEYYPFQEQFARRVIRSLLENDGEEITSLFSRQAGKSETIATTVGGCMVILPLLYKLFPDDPRLTMFEDGLWVGIFAPSERQAKNTYDRIRKRLNSKQAKIVLADPDIQVTFTVSNGQNVVLSNGSFASAISASVGASIEGESFKLLICEECQDISDFKIRKSIHPMGAAYNATIVKIGTSTTFVGDFYRAIQRNKENYKKDPTHSIKNHFEYDWRVVVKYNPKYAKYIEKEKLRLGETSDEFQMSYCLKWILVRGMFVAPSQFETRNLDVSRGIVSYDKERKVVAALDVAKKYDGSVLTILDVDWDNPVIYEVIKNEDNTTEEFIAYNSTILSWGMYSGDYENQYYAIMQDLSNYSVVRFVVDATREESFADRFKASLQCEVIPYVFSTQSKSVIYKRLDTEIKSGRAQVPADLDTQETEEFKSFKEQLYSLQKSYKGSNMVVKHSEDKIHDDFPDSWALGVWGCSFPISKLKITSQKENPLLKKNKSKFYKQRNALSATRRGY